MTLCTQCHEREGTVWTTFMLGVLSIRPGALCDVCAAERMRSRPPERDVDAMLHALGPLDFGEIEPQLALAEMHASPAELAGTADLLTQGAAMHGQTLPPAVRAFAARHP